MKSSVARTISLCTLVIALVLIGGAVVVWKLVATRSPSFRWDQSGGLSVSQDGRWLSYAARGDVYLCDVDNGTKTVFENDADDTPLCTLRAHDRLVVVNRKSIRVFNIAMGNCTQLLPIGDGTGKLMNTCAALSDDCALAAVGRFDGFVKVWDISSKRTSFELDCRDTVRINRGEHLCALSFVNHKQNLIVGSPQHLRVFDLATRTVLRESEFGNGPDSGKLDRFTVNREQTKLVITVGGPSINEVQIWSLSDLQLLERIPAPRAVRAARLSADEQLLLLVLCLRGSNSSDFVIWNRTQRRIMAEGHSGSEAFFDGVITNDGRQLILADYAGDLDTRSMQDVLGEK